MDESVFELGRKTACKIFSLQESQVNITVYYVVRVFKDGTVRYDSGPHATYLDASNQKDEDHYWNSDDYNIMESLITGVLL